MTCSILCQILFLSRLLGALAPTPLGAASGHSRVLEALTYRSPRTNWSWRWQFMAQKTSVDWCVFFDMLFSVTSQATCSFYAVWLSLLSSCINTALLAKGLCTDAPLPTQLCSCCPGKDLNKSDKQFYPFSYTCCIHSPISTVVLV